MELGFTVYPVGIIYIYVYFIDNYAPTWWNQRYKLTSGNFGVTLVGCVYGGIYTLKQNPGDLIWACLKMGDTSKLLFLSILALAGTFAV